MALALLFFVGDCAGSTAGSIKVVRHLVLARLLAARSCAPYIPSSCAPLDGAIMDQQALLAVIAFVLIYVAAFVLGTGVLALDAPFHGRAHTSALDLIFASASTLAGRNRGDGVRPSCCDSRSGISQAAVSLLPASRGREGARALRTPTAGVEPDRGEAWERLSRCASPGFVRCGTLARLGQ